MAHIDGLSGLCLAASETYSRHFKSSAFSKKHATQTLALLGHSGLSAIAANPSHTPSGPLSGPPLSVWWELLQQQEKNPAAQAGMLLCFFVVSEVDPMEAGKKGFKLDRGSIARKVLSTSEPKHVSVFAPIRKAIAEGKLFPTLSVQGDLPLGHQIKLQESN